MPSIKFVRTTCNVLRLFNNDDDCCYYFEKKSRFLLDRGRIQVLVCFQIWVFAFTFKSFTLLFRKENNVKKNKQLVQDLIRVPPFSTYMYVHVHFVNTYVYIFAKIVQFDSSSPPGFSSRPLFQHRLSTPCAACVCVCV